MELASLFSSPFALLVITLVIIGVVKAISVVYNVYFFWSKKNVPYMPDSLSSIVGSWKLFLRRTSLPDWGQYMYYYHADAKYLGIMDFSTPGLLIRDPDLIKDITVKDFEHFPDHRTFVDENAEPLFSKNIFSLRGDRWREMRNTLSPSFTASKMKFMHELIAKCSTEFVDYLVDHPELCSSIETKKIFRRYTTDVIATTAFGVSVNSMKDPNNEFFLKGVEATKFSSSVLTMFRMLFMRVFPRLAKALGVTFFPRATGEFFKRIVDENIKTREAQGIVRPDMIHLLMQARDKGSAHKLTLDDIVSQAFIFFLAGFDTASTLMCFVAHELAVNPDVQTRLRDEVDRHLAEGNGSISYDSMSKMVYMDMVVSEALRKYPPAIFTDRITAKRYELPPAQPGCKSLIIEPETVIIMSAYGLQNDPKYFPNPEKFDPERFNEENKDKIHPYTYLPFGLGPRKCIGNRFALMETKLLIAELLQKFILKPTEKTVYPVVFDKKEFALQPTGGFWLGLEKREKGK
ncbi:hypothetical protein DMN91_012170 [Ooceraea biroi]|uniref:Cytochrome P450 9e2 n=2 Tax=Ooceraea biroi TaxID=2015173 RepID=A0A3L8D4L2_OOCBI|nr:hypothetical protein DMN91_012170 [Ooceraea biroi]